MVSSIQDQRTVDLPTLQKGDRGFAVEILQQLLLSQGFGEGTNPENRLDVDGIFGDITLDYLQRFQNSKNLVSDGIVGHNTWKALSVI